MRAAVDRRALLALLVALAPAMCGAAELGRLFYSAQERAHLDELRRGDPALPAPRRVGSHVITGYVERSDGRGTVWVDGRPVPVTGEAQAKLLDPARVRDYSQARPALRRENRRR